MTRMKIPCRVFGLCVSSTMATGATKQLELIQNGKTKERTKKLFHGYIRWSEKEYGLELAFPSPVVEICIALYHSLYEYEYFEKCNDDLKISGDANDKITKISNEDNYNNIALGAKWIDSNFPNIIRWTIKCIQEGTYQNGVIVGIISNEIDLDLDPRWESDAIPSYFLMDDSYYCSTEAELIVDEEDIRYGKQESLLTMELDLKLKQLRYCIDGRWRGISIDIEHGDTIKYKLAISLWYTSQSLQIVNFEFL